MKGGRTRAYARTLSPRVISLRGRCVGGLARKGAQKSGPTARKREKGNQSGRARERANSRFIEK